MTRFESLAADVDTDLASEHVVVNDVRLHVVTAGPEDGDVVVLIHGFPEFWYSWREQIPALVDGGFRVVVPDLRGYKDSEKPHGVSAYRIDELVGDVAGLVKYYAADDDAPVDESNPTASAHVVGHDWGGGVAWSIAIRRPELVDRLAILNAPHPERFRELLRTPAQLRRSWYMLFFQLPVVPEYGLTRDDASLLEKVFEDVMPASERRAYRDAIQRPGAARSAVNYYRAFLRVGLRDELPFLSPTIEIPGGNVPVPTLVVWGEDDEALLSANADGLETWVPDLGVERVTDAGHWVQLDAPERVNDALRGHLE